MAIRYIYKQKTGASWIDESVLPQQIQNAYIGYCLIRNRTYGGVRNRKRELLSTRIFFILF